MPKILQHWFSRKLPFVPKIGQNRQNDDEVYRTSFERESTVSS
jgi:hypothetical protein